MDAEAGPSGSTEGASRLPPAPWLVVADPESGDTYYFNPTTNVTTWDFPGSDGVGADGSADGSDDGAQPSDSAATDAGKGGDTPADAQDAASTGGDSVTGEWLGDGPDPQAQAAATLPTPWMEVGDPETGDSYYFNPETGETTWDWPGSGASEPAAADGTSGADKEAAAGGSGADGTAPQNLQHAAGRGAAPVRQLPPPWLAVEDPSSGDTYYFNPATQATTWDFPGDGDSDGDGDGEVANGDGGDADRAKGEPSVDAGDDSEAAPSAEADKRVR